MLNGNRPESDLESVISVCVCGFNLHDRTRAYRQNRHRMAHPFFVEPLRLPFFCADKCRYHVYKKNSPEWGEHFVQTHSGSKKLLTAFVSHSCFELYHPPAQVSTECRQGNYAWITRPTIGEETIFLMGRSRGKGNAEELKCDVDNQVGISDDYAAYDTLFTKHQLCMSHPQRKLRDLHEAKTLSPTSGAACTISYQAFSVLYADLKKTLESEYQKDEWLQKREDFMKRLKEIAVVTEDDPQKLKAIKQSLTQNAEKYSTCLLQPGIPADNNKAERGL